MAEYKIKDDVFARDKHNVKRRVFVKGQLVEGFVINAVLRNNNVLNPEAIGVDLADTTNTQVLSMQTKTLTEDSPTLKELKEPPPKKEVVKKEESVTKKKTAN